MCSKSQIKHSFKPSEDLDICFRVWLEYMGFVNVYTNSTSYEALQIFIIKENVKHIKERQEMLYAMYIISTIIPIHSN
jgi:hypothetical protein